MEALTRLVADSLARHGFDRPIDPRRLQWSRWFRCDSTHSLLVVPSKPGIFALAEEIMDLGSGNTFGASKAHVEAAAPGSGNSHVGTDAFVRPASAPTLEVSKDREGHDFSRAANSDKSVAALAAEAPTRRMLAVVQFSEDDDMAFTLDRMFTCVHPMRALLASGRCFLRFVVIEDQAQRRSILQRLKSVDALHRLKCLWHRHRIPFIAVTGWCGAGALARHRRQHSRPGPVSAADPQK